MKRLALKSCQCGGRATWTPEKKARRRGQPTATAERVACGLCGNRTAPGTSRERLADEWNSAGWCGQGPADPATVPFGLEWQAQCMRMRKPELIKILAVTHQRVLRLDGLVARLRGELGEADMLIGQLRVKRNRRELAAVIDRLVQRGIVEKADAAGAKRKLAKEGGEG